MALANGRRLYIAAVDAVKESAPVALALGQIGLEETGKAMLLLCAATFSEKDDWREFWRRWHDHEAKAHMAFWFEWIDPLRLATTDKSGATLEGMPIRDRFSHEKEAGLYVDYDEMVGRFIGPTDRVGPLEVYSRLAILTSLQLTAGTIHDVVGTDLTFKLPVISGFFRHLWRGFQSQSQMLERLETIGTSSEAHSSFVAELKTGFAENRAILSQQPRLSMDAAHSMSASPDA